MDCYKVRKYWQVSHKDNLNRFTGLIPLGLGILLSQSLLQGHLLKEALKLTLLAIKWTMGLPLKHLSSLIFTTLNNIPVNSKGNFSETMTIRKLDILS